MILGNIDRHEGNVIIKDNKCYSIDNDSIGKGDSTVKEFMQEVDDRIIKNIIKDPIIDESGSPMVAWLDYNKLGIEGYKKFRKYIIKNMDSVINNSDKLIKYNNSSMTKSIGIKINNNIDDMREYYNKFEE